MQTLDAIESLAETDLPGAMKALQALKPLSPAGLLMEAELLARSGSLEEAFAPLQRIATSTASPAITLEAQVLHASVSAALDRFDEAIPRLEAVIADLERHPELAWLRSEASAELRAYRNLVSPKHSGTWASLLT